MGLFTASRTPHSLSLTTRLVGTGAILTFVVLVYTYTHYPSLRTLPLFQGSPDKASSASLCSPSEYAAGHWAPMDPPRTNKTEMSEKEDSLPFAGFQRCASSREFWWHLAADQPEQWARFPGAQSQTWQPSQDCNIRQFEVEGLLKQLVERGGWLLIGDSVTENHFFSLSCTLGQHVRATPDYTAGWYERDHPQNLYLLPDSPLVPFLNLPPGFSFDETPLVTFKRVDLLLSPEELVKLHKDLHKEPEDFKLFSDETLWSASPTEYLEIFADPIKNYHTMIASTAGHWTTTVFSGLMDESKEETFGIEDVVSFFEEAMGLWARTIQTGLDAIAKKEAEGRPTAGVNISGRRQVVIRAYLPGHEDCHEARAPWTAIKPFVWNWYNWSQIGDFNRVFERVLANAAFPDVSFLAIDRPARLRPDAHVAGDCLHIMTGAGVIEGWTHYIWHYITEEVRK